MCAALPCDALDAVAPSYRRRVAVTRPQAHMAIADLPCIVPTTINWSLQGLATIRKEKSCQREMKGNNFFTFNFLLHLQEGSDNYVIIRQGNS